MLALHGRELAAQGAHVFQTERFPHGGLKNGMHRFGSFWAVPERAALSLRSASCTLILVTRSAGSTPMIAAPQSVSSAAYSIVFHDSPSSIQKGIASLPASRAIP